ncbi:MAG: hypothetical protein KDD70_01555 [Bdellovibrionales bacterium]|nr:hypothetical protein [Bdellovibrionales bacterium]
MLKLISKSSESNAGYAHPVGILGRMFGRQQLGIGLPATTEGATAFAIEILTDKYRTAIEGNELNGTWLSSALESSVGALRLSLVAGQEDDLLAQAGFLQIAANHLRVHNSTPQHWGDRTVRLVTYGIEELVRAGCSEDSEPVVRALNFLSEADRLGR